MYSKELDNMLRSFARKLTNSFDVEDLVQQTYLKMYANSEKFNGQNIKGWACTILKNEFINICRAGKYRTNEVIDVANLKHSPLKADEPINISDIESYINTLPNKVKVSFKYYLIGYRYEEIAEKMNVPLGTVKGYIFRARNILQKQVA